jgi:hypothetical protein
MIFQAKSKKLTLEARKGNDGKFRDDFKKAVQDAYDQGLKCANLLEDENCSVSDPNGNTIKIPQKYKEIYIICVVSEHYPSLTFQIGEFLKYETSDKIQSPIVMDIFSLDTITEMLPTPLYFLNYVYGRAKVMIDKNSKFKIMAENEFFILFHHLKRNLCIGEDASMVIVDSHAAGELDNAMMVRRGYMEGKDFVDGILEKHRHTVIGKLISQIESTTEDPDLVDFSMVLFFLGDRFSNEIDRIVERSKQDGARHDLLLTYPEIPDIGSCAIIIYCGNYSVKEIKAYIAWKKNEIDANAWFGIHIEQPYDRWKAIVFANKNNEPKLYRFP